MSLYDIKPHFQNLLRPLVKLLYKRGVTANQVTLFAFAMTCVVCLLVAFNVEHQEWFLLLPVCFFLRMALNAIDGMLAREFDQQSTLGFYLNELTDVLADAACILPFLFLDHVSGWLIFTIIWLATLSEYIGVLAFGLQKDRRYDGPMGKSDRVFVLAVLAVLIATTKINLEYTWLLNVVLVIVAVLLCITCYNRMVKALQNK